MRNEQRTEELRDLYMYAGFYPSRTVNVAPWDEEARIISLKRRSKKLNVVCAEKFIEAGMTGTFVEYVTCPVEMPEFSLSLM